MAARGGDGEASLIVDNQPRELARVHAWVQDWASHQQLAPSVAHSIDLCSTEVVTNIINHAGKEGHGGQAAQHIHLRLGWVGDDVALEVEDEGSRFDPREVAAPAPATTLQDTRVGGWGIPIVRHFSDELRYRHEGGRNHLTLVFRAGAAQ